MDLDSDLADVKCVVPQRSILGSLTFLVYTTDLHCAIKGFKPHQFLTPSDKHFKLHP